MPSLREIQKKILNSRFYCADKNLVISYKRFLWANPVMCVLNTTVFVVFMCQVFSAINGFFGIGEGERKVGCFVGYTIILLFFVYINYLLAYKFFKTDEVITGGDAKKTHITKKLQRLFLADLSLSSMPLIPFLTTFLIWKEWKDKYSDYVAIDINAIPEGSESEEVKEEGEEEDAKTEEDEEKVIKKKRKGMKLKFKRELPEPVDI